MRAERALRRADLSAQQRQAALAPPPLQVSTVKPVDPQRDRRGGLAFFAAMLLYGQLIGYGFYVAMGVVEEKSSRVVEVLLSAIRARHLLAGKVIGLGLLGLGQLLTVVTLGLVAATAVGAVEIDGDVIAAAALALVWFVVGYAFYACLFACAGALVPRQEELQSVTTPLTLVLLISFFISFGVLNDPDGTLAHVTAFIPIDRADRHAGADRARRGARGRGHRGDRGHARRRGRADPAGRAHLLRRGAADGLRREAARGLARRARLTALAPACDRSAGSYAARLRRQADRHTSAAAARASWRVPPSRDHRRRCARGARARARPSPRGCGAPARCRPRRSSAAA